MLLQQQTLETQLLQIGQMKIDMKVQEALKTKGLEYIETTGFKVHVMYEVTEELKGILRGCL